MARPMVVASWSGKWAYDAYIASNSRIQRPKPNVRYAIRARYGTSTTRLKRGNDAIRGFVRIFQGGYDKK